MSEAEQETIPLSEREIAVMVRQLSGGVDPNDVASDLCVAKNMPWREAEAVVARVQAEHGHHIRRWNKTSLTVIGAGIVVGGGLLSFVPALNIFRIIRYAVRTGQFSLRPIFQGDDLSYLSVAMPLQLQPYFLFIGMAMIMGGLVGIYFALREESLE
ncbi:hypothetical protein ADN00_12720 [Ornatilinea apprima]|uniref:Uncharacterized protein n=1 Tax=Ornatilinea apprima TaxID=1134406 RepID=A0A0P6X5T7_9CHLR|nr:hypothetical protein [Ornatilinea apprima]KPL75505.1 hypothetical protein ADN00_12720 [Ornatilinea apprima]